MKRNPRFSRERIEKTRVSNFTANWRDGCLIWLSLSRSGASRRNAVKRLSVEYKLLGAFVGGGLMIALAAWFALASGRGYLEASAQGEHLSDGARAVAAMLDVLQDAEWSYRGYLLTGRADALSAHFAEPDAAQAHLARAQALIGGDADTRAHLARLAQIVPARLAELRANV